MAKNKNSVNDLIKHISTMFYNNDPLLNCVQDPNMLYNALCDLNEIIGMYEVKDSIIKQIKFLLVNASHESDNISKFDNHMLHTVIFGPPGVGKTTIGICLAKIWKSLGLVTKKKINEENNEIEESDEHSKMIPFYIIAKKIQSLHRNPNPNSKLKLNQTSQTEETVKINTELNKKDLMPCNRLILNKKQKLDTNNIDEKDTDCISSLDEMFLIHQQIRSIELMNSCVANINSKYKSNHKYTQLSRIKSDESCIKIVSRPDFVGEYIGHSGAKTLKLLTATLEQGQVLFIDEAYSLVADTEKDFGMEVLTILINFMSTHPELIVIFAGYENKMKTNLFLRQPGLERRCTWFFKIENYTGEMLMAIFLKQLSKDGWIYENNDNNLESFFNQNIKFFPSFGGDTQRLTFYCKLKYSELKFDNPDSINNKIITFDIIKESFKTMFDMNKLDDKEINNNIHNMMYI